MSESLGPYELRGELGRGAMAIVWRAWDPNLEREVAIKEPIVAPGTDAIAREELAARFVREGKAAAKLNHPGIVTIYAADIYAGRPAIIMEIIDGETLASVLERGPLSPAAAMSVIDQLLGGVGYAHAHGVVHRDIKPDNVFVTNEGRIKLADFGIAHVGASSALTQAGTVMGTPGYMSPEQVTGQPVDARADLFAIGVILHELLTGDNPFGATDGSAPTTVMYRIVHEPMVELPAQIGQALPLDIGLVLAIATAKDPANRFADANAFRAALAGGPAVPGTPGTVMNIQTPGGWAPANVASSPPGPVKWGPYLIAGAVMVVIVGMLFAFSSGGVKTSGASSGAMTVSPATATATDPAPPTPKEPAVVPQSVDPAVAQAGVAQTINDWRAAWGRMDFAGYMSFYGPTFYSQYKGMNRDQWQQYKSGLFAKYSYQNIDISTPQITVTGATATATFEQTFRSNSFRDQGTKTLTLTESGGRWLIVGEEFQAR